MSIHKIYSALAISLFLLQNWLAAQCPITVNAGPDVVVCEAGNTGTLNGSITGPFLGFAWTPTTGLSNPNVINPTVTVTGPMTYTLTAQAINPSATNLVTNPAFENGNTGFTSVYTYNPLPITPGTYVLTTSPALVLSTFPPCDDHTYGNGTGNMMLVNGNAVTGSQVWCQNINVAQNTWYVMSAWVMASPLFPPTMQFAVNGTLVGDPYPVGTGSCNWQQFAASWYSGSATTAQLCITDQISGGNGFLGDDYALDDIFFAPACSVSDQVNVSIATVNANSPATIVLPCNAVQTGIVLIGAGSSTGPGYSYQWTGPGIMSGANSINATVNQEGQYTLTVTFNTGSGTCTKQSTTLVLPDPNVVVAAAATTETLTCVNPTATLDGTGSSMGGTISYSWQPGSGVVSGQGTLMPEVNQPGTYTLTVTNSISGCTATATVLVNQNNTLPTAAAAAPTPLSCTVTEVILSGTGSSTGPNFEYLWTGPGIVSGETLLNNCTVNLPGPYQLLVTNTTNGCTATATATVGQNGTPPTASAIASNNLSCTTATATLNSTGSSTGPNISYGWSTPNGHFTGPTNGPSATVDSAGTYILTVTNTANGCTASASVTVSGNFTLPTVGIASPVPMLNCLVDSVQLDASQSSSGSGFGLVWASQNGTFLSGDTTLMPWVGSAGVYTLTITNTANGCTASASATVTENSTPPIAQAGPNATLDCDGSPIQLNGSGSSTGPNFSYQWTTAGGNIISGDTTLTPSVDGVGTYFLWVENAANGCTALDTVAVNQDANAPIVQIAPPSQLNCLNDEVTLDATGSSAGANIALIWNGPSFSGGQNTYTPTVNAPGVYSLTLLNQTNNCEATASVTVVLDTLSPVADAGTAPLLDCAAQTGTLNGSGSSQGPSFSYLWSSGDTILMPTISAAGTYSLTVTNNANGCTASDSVTVAPFGNVPSVDIAQPGNLDCTVTQIQLSATASMGAEFSYNWTFTGTGVGMLSGDTTLMPTIGSPGTYTLTVTNTGSNCSASDSVQVVQNGTPPTVVVNGTQTLLCGQTSIQVNGVGNSPNGVSYAWTTQNGNILSGASTPNIQLNAPGTYTLTVTDLLTGCTASDDVLVNQDANAPIAVAGAPQTLTCSVQSLVLNGTGSSTGPGISYLWTTINGVIESGETTLSPTVTAPGTYLLTVTNATNNCETLASVQVLEHVQQPDAIAAVPQPLGCTLLTTFLDGTGSSTGPNFSYLWTGPGVLSGATTLMPQVNATGLYTLQVTNTTTGCVTFAQITVPQDLTPPTVIAAAPQPLTCVAQQVQLSGTGSSTGANYAYLWAGPGIVSGGTTLSPTVNLVGGYTLTITNTVTGCTAAASTNLTQNTTPPSASAAAPQPLTCIAQQVQLSGTGSSTGAGFGYQWAGPGIVNGATTLSPTVNASGLYTLTVTSQANGCTATASATANQSVTPPTAVAAAPQNLDCTMQQVQLSGTGSSTGAGFGYQWVGPGIVVGVSTLTPTVNAPGLYTLTVTNQANGCTASASAMVNISASPPLAAAAAPQMLTCVNLTAALSGTGSSVGLGIVYAWAGPGIVNGGSTLTPTVNLPGTYTLTVSNQANGCTATAQAVVVQNVTPPVVDAGPPATLACGQTSLVLQGTSNVPNATFSWTTVNGSIVSGAGTASPMVDGVGTYFLQVTNPANGCTATDSTVVTESPGVFPTPTIEAPTCAEPLGSVSFSGTALYYYSIDGVDFSTSGLFEGLLPGDYTFTIVDVIGCKASVEVNLPAVPFVSVNLTPIASLQAGGALVLNPQPSVPASQLATISWSPAEGLSCTDCLQPTASPASDANYTVQITTLEGCMATASITITVTQPAGDAFVPNAFSPNDDGINDLLMVFADEKQVKQVVSFQVFTRWGESVFEGFGLRPNDVTTGWDGTARSKKVDVGVYVWFAEVELVNGERKVLKGDVMVVK
jgi:gliding motility-associated-like protein